jgi:hypothetical protein
MAERVRFQHEPKGDRCLPDGRLPGRLGASGEFDPSPLHHYGGSGKIQAGRVCTRNAADFRSALTDLSVIIYAP